jgi:hypothetical protein
MVEKCQLMAKRFHNAGAGFQTQQGSVQHDQKHNRVLNSGVIDEAFDLLLPLRKRGVNDNGLHLSGWGNMYSPKLYPIFVFSTKQLVHNSATHMHR